MYVTIKYVNGTQQTFANATGLNNQLTRNVGSVTFYDSQGDHTVDFELDKVEAVTWHKQEGEMKPLWHV